MGRHYSGDISGKFLFGIQSSDDASFFGGTREDPGHIDFYFTKDDLPDINAGIKTCTKELGTRKGHLDAFFESHDGYTDEDIAQALGFQPSDGATRQEVYDVLEWYARLRLGTKIVACVKDNGQCSFEAEI